MIPKPIKSAAKKILPRPIYAAVRRIIFAPKEFCEWRHNRWLGMKAVRFIERNREEKIILLAGVHEAGNIGDHAISVAEREFMERYFPDYAIVEMPTSVFRPAAARINAVHCKHMVLAVPGGGFLGNLWPSEEKMFRQTLKVFRENKVVVFPQTIYFDGRDRNYRRDLDSSIRAYNSHGNLSIFIRDKSIDFLKENVVRTARVRLFSAPDIVLSLDRSGGCGHQGQETVRSGILFCFRSDKEKIQGEGAVRMLVEKARESDGEIRFTDTCEPYMIPPAMRGFATEKKFAEFRSARLVVTDRLHGMIFAAITGTPCVALDNVSGKVRGVWETWLRDTPYVRFAASAEEAAGLIPALIGLGGQRWNPDRFGPEWEKIAAEIGA